jgi:PAS domain S-box-containing protein
LIATDLTAKRRAEEAVRESQRLIGRVADASPAILYVYDFASERCVYVNHQVEKILGYTREEVLRVRKWLDDQLVHREDGAILTQRRRLLSENAEEGAVFEYTLRLRHADGEWRWMRAREVVFTRGDDGRPAQILGMAEDITERRRAAEQRERSREQLRALSARLQEAREEERAAISRRVHDELGQALTALSWELTKLGDQLGPESQSQPDITKRLTGMSAMVEGMMQIVRKVAAELRPPILDHFGLVAALEWQAKEFQERYRIPCDVAARVRGETPDRTVSTAIFRIFQEILTNVARHSAAKRVRVEFNDGPHGYSLIVQDNGRGITEGEKAQSLGILGMRERAHLFGGSIDIKGSGGLGTTVTVHIPSPRRKSSMAPRKESLRSPV